MPSQKGVVPTILALLWTGLGVVMLIAATSGPDPYGLNAYAAGFVLVVWAVGLAVGAGITALVRRWRTR